MTDKENTPVMAVTGVKIGANKAQEKRFSNTIVPFNDYNVKWISQKINEKTGAVSYKVLPPILAEHIRTATNYLFIRDSAKQGVQRFYYSPNEGYYRHISDDEMKGLIKAFIPVPLQKMNDINECMNLLYTDHKYYNMDEINANENIINFQNGTLELDTMTLREHSPEDLCTIQIQCNYDPTAQPVNGSFDYFIDFFTGNDKAVKQLLLEYMGVIISNIHGWRMKKGLFMVGKTNAGKSQLKALTERLIGKGNYAAVDLDDLEARFGTSNIFNKRLAGSSDMSYMTVKELKIFKRATGGDQLFAEYKGENGFDFIFNGLLWFCCNQLPKFGGDKGDAVFNRIIVVECMNVADKLDKHLQDKMFMERDYIVSLAINSLHTVIENDYNFSVPDKCTTAVNEYKTEVNSFLKFIEECTVSRPNGAIKDGCTCKRLYDVYMAWCRDNNSGYYESKRDIKPLLDSIGKANKKTVQGREYYSEFTLSLNTRFEYQKEYDCYDNDMRNPPSDEKPKVEEPPQSWETVSQAEQQELDKVFGVKGWR